MDYPMTTHYDMYGREYYAMMTPDEYRAQLAWYDNYRKIHANDTGRHVSGYVSYLNCWFGDGRCDGFMDGATRIRLHKLPMSFNAYCYE